MFVPQLLLETLEELRQYDFKNFKFLLSENILDGCNRIRPAHLENATRVQTARKMIESYGEDSAVKVTLEVLKEMNCNALAEELESRYAAGKPATPSSSIAAGASSSSSITDPAAMTAQHGASSVAHLEPGI